MLYFRTAQSKGLSFGLLSSWQGARARGSLETGCSNATVLPVKLPACVLRIRFTFALKRFDFLSWGLGDWDWAPNLPPVGGPSQSLALEIWPFPENRMMDFGGW